jgi:rod shape-determining protein MreC
VALQRRAPRQRTLVVALALLSIVIVTVDLRSEDGAVSAMRRTTRDVFAPVDGVVDAVVSPVADVFDGIFHAGELKDENEALRAQLAQARSDLAQVQSDIIENQELTALLDLQVQGSTEAVVAQVVSGAPNNFQSTVQIDKGSAEGLERGMAVVIGDATGQPVLVGRLTEVATHTATVRLLHDRESRISVWIPVYRQAGILAGEGDPERLSIDEVPISADERPRVGQIVETSGRDGSELPPGLIVGSVSSVDDSPPGALDTHVEVRPIADLERVTHVRVITDYTPGELQDDTTSTTAVTGSGPPGTAADGTGSTTTTTVDDSATTTAPEASG